MLSAYLAAYICGLPLLNATCELQHSFRYLNQSRFKSFKADQWLVAITLTPKVDSDINLAGGFTRKIPGVANALRLTTWVMGTAPGVQLDAKGNRTGSITYNIKSQDLIKDVSLMCDTDSPTYHALTRHLGVGEWLYRSAVGNSQNGVAQVDKPTFSSDITIKFGGTGTYTYAFPVGSDLATFGGSYQLDELLNCCKSI